MTLTLFSCPKPFTDPHTAVIQRNAITSWTLLCPKPEIILFSNSKGVFEICKELRLRHIPDIAQNESGTPLLNDIFKKAQDLTTNNILCYINADICLMGDFLKTLNLLSGFQCPFVLSGGRWNLDIKQILDFYHSNWEEKLRAMLRRRGNFNFWGNDYFVFSRGLFQDMPPLAIGRGWFDGWLFWKALSSNAAVIDASKTITAVHQDHDYSHVNAFSYEDLCKKEEAQRNFKLAGVAEHWVLLDQATHLLTSNGLKKAWVGGRIWLYRLRSMVQGGKIYKLFVYKFGPLRHALGLHRRKVM